ncbi:MAG: AAA family ATPase, partial [Thermoplasmatota archaeon]
RASRGLGVDAGELVFQAPARRLHLLRRRVARDALRLADRVEDARERQRHAEAIPALVEDDAEARRAIFRAELADRPAAADLDLDELVLRTEGMTPASIEKIVDAAALEVFREAAQSGKQLEVDSGHLLAAIDRLGGQDRPTVERWTWDSLVLPPEIKAQLQQLQSVIEDPESARRFGIDPPTGLLLAGPPGTGKTTVAKVLAAQARCSFYPVSGADVMSKWVVAARPRSTTRDRSGKRA